MSKLSYNNTEIAESYDVAQQEIWGGVKKKIINLYGEIVFKSWFKSVDFAYYDIGTIFLTVSSRFIRDWIKTNYLDFILKAWREFDKRVISIDLIIGGENGGRNFVQPQHNNHHEIKRGVTEKSQPIVENHSISDFFSIIVDTNKKENTEGNKALSVKRNYSFEDIVENLTVDFDEKKEKTKVKKEKIIKTNFFQKSLSLINDLPSEVRKRDISIHKDEKIHFHENNALPRRNEANLYFDKRFTFDNFVKDESNELAFFAAKSIADNIQIHDSGVNPLFLYGGVGLGKTHLIHAIANHKIQSLRENHPNDWEKIASEKIVYSSSEKFMREFLAALRNRDTKSFKSKFRNIDILMIDDIQFLNGKGCTQEEFFHIFSGLMGEGKQLVISADRVPSALSGIEDKLKSRLGCGIVADIKKGDYKFRYNILRRKIEFFGCNFDDKILDFLAKNIHNSIRELEGALNNLLMMQKLSGGKAIDLPFVKEKLADMIESNREKNDSKIYDVTPIASSSIPSSRQIEQRELANNHDSMRSVAAIRRQDKDFICKIQSVVSNYYNVSIEDMNSSKRTRNIVLPKQIAMYISKKMTSETLTEIAKKFGGKDHSTIIHGISKVEKLLREDKEIHADIEKIVQTIKNQ